jgi:hypothetical protein
MVGDSLFQRFFQIEEPLARLFYFFVIPALRLAQDKLAYSQAGIQQFYSKCLVYNWIPAFAGMTA